MAQTHCPVCYANTDTEASRTNFSYVCGVCGNSIPYQISLSEVVTYMCDVCGKTVSYASYFNKLEFVTMKGSGDTPFVINLTGVGSTSLVWTFYDGTLVTNSTGASCSYQFTTAGPHRVTLSGNLSVVTSISSSNNKITSVVGVSLLTSLTSIIITGTAVELALSLAALSSGVTYIRVDGTTSIVGSIDRFVLTYIYCNSAITGSLDSMSVDATSIMISHSAITGTDIGRFTKITNFTARYCGMDQTRVNAIIDSAYAAKDDYLHAVTLALQNNVAPSAAQKTKADELRTSKGWTVSYDA